MNQCRECGKGYCPNRARRVFGHLPPNYYSPQCFTKSRVGLAEFQKEQVREKFDARSLAMEIIDELTAHDVIDAEPMGDPEKFAAAVSLVAAKLKV